MSDIQPTDTFFIVHYNQERYDDDPRNGGWYLRENLFELFNQDGVDALLLDQRVTMIHSVQEVIKTTIVNSPKVLARMKEIAREKQEREELEQKLEEAKEAEAAARKERAQLEKQLKKK